MGRESGGSGRLRFWGALSNLFQGLASAIIRILDTAVVRENTRQANMAVDNNTEGDAMVIDSDREVIEKQRLRLVSASLDIFLRHHRLIYFQLPGSSDTAASFALEREDHTLGNALRYLITKKYVVALSPN